MGNIKEFVINSFIGDLWRNHKLNKMKRKWRSNNSFNDTIAMCIFDLDMVNVGKYSYGELNVVSFGHEHKLKIGNYVSIAQHVTFLLDVEHYINHISTFPYKVKCLHTTECEAFGKGDIIVGDDVWIGYGATIMSGVHIGQGAVIAAGAVVTKDVPPYAIIGGTPAKVIKYRFGEVLRNKALEIDYSKLNKELIYEHIEDLYERLLEQNQFDWFPRK